MNERHQHADQPFTSFKKYRSVIKFATDFEPVRGGRKLGDYLVSDVEIHHLEPMFRSWCASHKGQSRHFMRDMLSGLFRRLVKRKVIDDNPAEDLPKFKRKAKKARLKTTDSDLTSMFEAADVRLRAMLLLSRRNLRIGEILGLTEACIDGRRVTVSRQANTIEHPDKDGSQSSLWALTHLKHNGDERVMVLDEAELVVVLASLELAKPVSIYNTITERWETHRFVIPNAKGGDWHYNDFIRALKALTKKCNVQFTSHDGRRLFATNILAEDHVSPDAVRVSMGHSDINVTMLYAKSDRDSERVVNEVASRQVKAVFGLTSTRDDDVTVNEDSDLS